MIFEDVDMDFRAIQTPSYTSLRDYCNCTYWKEENMRFSKKRKTTEIGEYSCDVENETVDDVINDIWVDDEPSFDVTEELEDLQDAYKVMSKMAAEYVVMERAASKFTSNQGYRHEGALPIIRTACDTNEKCRMQSNMPRLLPVQSNIVPIIYKENTAMCRDWLMQHYESKEGVSIPRSAMYSHYLDFCGEGYNDPLNPAGFGKAVRSVFTSVQTRRLGNRGASKYHYYGLSIKDSSPYKSMLLGTQRVNNMLDVDTPAHQLSSFHPRTLSQNNDGLGMKVVLEGFPSVSCVIITQELKLQLKVFLSMYKTHCENILDIVLQTSFSDIKDAFLHFWKNLSQHILTLMSHDSIVNIVHLCDVALYKTIGGMLLPNINQSQPQNLLSSIRTLTENLIKWTELAVLKLPENLKKAKLTAVKDFKQQMNRQSMLNHITQCVKTTIRDHDIMKKMLSDWLALDQLQITKEILRNIGEEEDIRSLYHVRKCMRDFERHLSHRVSLDKYLSFVSNILHNCTSNMIMQSDIELEEAVSKFMLHWMSAVNSILRELTINAVQTFGSFHLLSMLFTDYLMYLIEERKRALAEVKLKDLVYRGNKTVAATPKVTGKVPEYKPIAPKSGVSISLMSRLAGNTDESHESDMANSKLSSIMNQLSSMNQVKKMENQHLYLATPIKLNQSDNSNVAMKNIISQITNKILLESRIVKPSNVISEKNCCIKTEGNRSIKRDLSENEAEVLCKTKGAHVDLNNIKLELGSQHRSDSGEINKQFLLCCNKPVGRNNKEETDVIRKGMQNGKHPPGYIIKKKENIKIVSLSTLKQSIGKGLDLSKGVSDEVHIVDGSHLLQSNHALKILKNSLKSASSVLQSKKLCSDITSKPEKVHILEKQLRNVTNGNSSISETQSSSTQESICESKGLLMSCGGYTVQEGKSQAEEKKIATTVCNVTDQNENNQSIINENGQNIKYRNLCSLSNDFESLHNVNELKDSEAEVCAIDLNRLQ